MDGTTHAPDSSQRQLGVVQRSDSWRSFIAAVSSAVLVRPMYFIAAAFVTPVDSPGVADVSHAAVAAATAKSKPANARDITLGIGRGGRRLQDSERRDG